MFWLSYESFSILYDVFCQKRVISSKNRSAYAFGFRVGFRKILFAFDFDEKLTQSVGHIIMKFGVCCTLWLIRCFQFEENWRNIV